TAGAAATGLSLRTFTPRPVGFHRISGVLHGADAGIVAGRPGSRSVAQTVSLARAFLPRPWDSRQKLHRPKPGIRVVRGCARLPGGDVGANEPNVARGAARGDWHRFPHQYA